MKKINARQLRALINEVVESELSPPLPEDGYRDEEAEWHAVFNEFLLMREEMGEPTDDITFEQFVEKLQKIKDRLLPPKRKDRLLPPKHVEFFVSNDGKQATIKASVVTLHGQK